MQPVISYFNRVTQWVFAVILFFLVLGILIGTAKLFFNLADVLTTFKVTGSYQKIISDVLSLFILIELSRSLAEYFDSHRLRMTFIVDAVIVFVLREIMIKLFEQKITTDEIYALSVLLLVLGGLRIASALVHLRVAGLPTGHGHQNPADG